MSDCVILSPVYQPYRWLAPLLQSQLDRHWPAHPPLVCAGLTEAEAAGLPAIAVHDPALPRDWCVFMREACETLRQRGVTRCYLIPEEHPPLGPCHAEHLNETLPGLLDELDASYISLLGWDNRRSVHYGPSLGSARWHLRDLRVPLGPRFQLHPALWRLDALIACLDATLALPKHSPWSFETTARRADAPLPQKMKDGCYRVSATAMSARPPGAAGRMTRKFAHVVWRRLSGLTSWLPPRARTADWSALKFDHFFDDGPYPLFFGGVMVKGTVNRHYWRHLARQPQERNAPLIAAILEHHPKVSHES